MVKKAGKQKNRKASDKLVWEHLGLEGEKGMFRNVAGSCRLWL